MDGRVDPREGGGGHHAIEDGRLWGKGGEGEGRREGGKKERWKGRKVRRVGGGEGREKRESRNNHT